MGLYLTFACMGFSTGWSSVDSIFQQVNKYVMVYEDLSFASSLVYITSAAAATVLLLTFLGLYCAPNGVELRTVAFFETTITAVLAASCTVQLSLALYWDHARWVVETCAFVGAMMGNIQAFIIYPFFNAFYRTELLGAMNVGETSTSLFCGVLALVQSPSAGGELQRHHVLRHRFRRRVHRVVRVGVAGVPDRVQAQRRGPRGGGSPRG